MRLRKLSEVGKKRDRSPSESEPSENESSSSISSSSDQPRRLRLRRLGEASVEKEEKRRRESLESLPSKQRRKMNKEEVEESDSSYLSASSSDGSDFIASDSEGSAVSPGFYSRIDRMRDEEETVTMPALSSCFLSYIEFIISMIISPCDSLVAKNRAVLRRVENEIQTRRDSALSSRWSLNFRVALESFPHLNISSLTHPPEGKVCDSCGRGGWNFALSLGGVPLDSKRIWNNDMSEFYNATKLLPPFDQPTIHQTSTITDQIIKFAKRGLGLGKSCAANVAEYHRLHFWKFEMLKKVHAYLKKHRQCWQNNQEAIEWFRQDIDTQSGFELEFRSVVDKSDRFAFRHE